MRRTFSALAAAGLMLLGGISLAPQASAADTYGCSGSLVGTYDLKTDNGTGTKYGELYLYYSSANGGTNCAAAVDTHFASGVTKYQAVYLWRCVAGTHAGDFCSYDQSDSDDGNFTWYAGPAKVTGTANRCVMVYGRVDDPNNSKVADTTVLASHCG
ncbi:hypothetical protein [Kitasatospora fiedleri]|uniref:hypothetical protein n=1 Tax=Kitasatospora fiedleri TaxID=2991545 RepID=UPI000C2B5C10|nr:hypothetical protein [Kitasatospora fiedleri]